MKIAFAQAFKLFLFLSLLTGAFYPALVTGIAQLVFPDQANGSLIKEQNKIIGSELLGQNFNDPKYFYGRISATSPEPYNAQASSGSNLGPSNEKLVEQAKSRKEQTFKDEPLIGDASSYLLTSSGSGLDPHISPDSAMAQADRVAKRRGLDKNTVLNLVKKHMQTQQLGILGEPVVNVLTLNLDLDKSATSNERQKD